MLSITGEPGGGPVRPGASYGDLTAGLFATVGILGALHERHATGIGRKVEVSMFEAMTHFNLDAFQHLFSANEVMGPFSRPSVSQSYVLKCGDGKWIALHMSSPEKFWQGLAAAMERPDIFDDPRFATREARIDNQEAMIETLGPIFAGRDRAEWCRRLEAADVPHAPMYTTAEVPEDAQAKHLQLFVETTHPETGRYRTVRSPVSFDGERALEVTAPPLLGEHNADLGKGWPERQPAHRKTA
jgi:crotonobetainyl-CoA:carnitine CoA-transferase CaiB-like acyl-CoA transferase